MVTDAEYEQIHEQAWKDSEKFMTSGGYFFSDSYTEDDKVKLENLLWNAAKSYVNGDLSSSAFNVVCSDYQGNPVYYSLSPEAIDLVSLGLELDYFMYIEEDKEKINEIQSSIKKLVLNNF